MCLLSVYAAVCVCCVCVCMLVSCVCVCVHRLSPCRRTASVGVELSPPLIDAAEALHKTVRSPTGTTAPVI